MTTKQTTKKVAPKKEAPKPRGFGFPFKVRVVVTNLVKGGVAEKAVIFKATESVTEGISKVVTEVLAKFKK